MIDFDALMKQAKNFQQQFQADLEKMAVASTSGGGAVRVVVNGSKEITNIEFQPEALKDHEMLADMVLAAVSGAYAEVDRQLKEKMPGPLGSMDFSKVTDMLNQFGGGKDK